MVDLNKKNLGQFFTTNSKYIVGNLLNYYPNISEITDPFAGNYDLLNLFEITKIGYDIDPKNTETIKQNTLLNPPDYKNKWIIANPPYLAKNKNNSKNNTNEFKKINSELYEKYKVNDLYKVAIKSLMDCLGGILIIPINFFCEENSEIRNEFLSKFVIKQLNIFEETVFDDTDYSVCSFFFEKKDNIEQDLNIIIFPNKNKINFKINKEDNYRIGADFFKLLDVNSDLIVGRLVYGDISNSNLKLRAIDSGTINGRICLSIEEPYFDLTPNKTERTFCTLKFNKNFTIEQQKIIAEKFNSILEENRLKYNSLFLTNYRNSTNSYARKRIGFDLAYKIVKYVVFIYIK